MRRLISPALVRARQYLGVLVGMLLQLAVRKPPKEEKPVKADFRFLFSVSLLVPEGFNHGTCLNEFRKRRRHEFYCCREGITDEHYAHPSVHFMPGQRIKAKFFAVSGKPATQEGMAFIREQKGFPPGAHGLTLVYEQARYKLLTGKVYAFLDEEDSLWKTRDNLHLMPVMPVYPDGDVGLGLVALESPLDQDNLILVSFHHVDGVRSTY